MPLLRGAFRQRSVPSFELDTPWDLRREKKRTKDTRRRGLFQEKRKDIRRIISREEKREENKTRRMETRIIEQLMHLDAYSVVLPRELAVLCSAVQYSAVRCSTCVAAHLI